MIELNKYIKGRDLDEIMAEYRKTHDALDKEFVNDGEPQRITGHLTDLLSAIHQGNSDRLDQLVYVSMPNIIAITQLYKDKGLTLYELLSLATDEFVKIAQDPECPMESDIEFVKHYVARIKQFFNETLK